MTARRYTRILLLAGVALGILLAAAACASPPGDPVPSITGAPSGGGGAAPGGDSSVAAAESDWQHTLQVIANLRAKRPSQPVVYLLGGSVARECIPSEASWAGAVQAAGAPAALTYDLGSRNRTTAQDLKLVAKLPDVPTILFIGMNVGRFTPAPSSPTVTLPAPKEPLPAWQQHRYSTAVSLGVKQSLLERWLTRRYPLFKQHYTYNLGMLEKLIKAAKARGFHPVLLDLPRNTAVIGSKMDGPVGRYHRSCRSLAAEYDIPWVDFVSAAKLANRDFYDLWHLIRTGRLKWQPLLAARTATLLDEYEMGATPSPSPSPSASASP